MRRIVLVLVLLFVLALVSQAAHAAVSGSAAPRWDGPAAAPRWDGPDAPAPGPLRGPLRVRTAAVGRPLEWGPPAAT
jgi:hypothetical protein